jgi:hypothetical protein
MKHSTMAENLLESDEETAVLIKKEPVTRSQYTLGITLFFGLVLLGIAALPGRGAHGHTVPSESLADASIFAKVTPGPDVFPIRLLLFRHGMTCGNAGTLAACADPSAPILHLSKTEQEALFDKLDSIGTTFPAPKLLPVINRSFGIQGRGKHYTGGDPPRPEGFRGDDCILGVKPWTNDSQWHEMGNVIQLRHFYRDPPLTDCSAFQSVKAGKAFRAWLKAEGIKLDFLGASMLTRTFQTAHYQLLSDPEAWKDVFSPSMLEGSNAPLVSQLPFVNEYNPVWGYQADDFAWPQDQQRQNLVSAIGRRAVDHLDYSHLQGFSAEERKAHDWEKFKEKMLGPHLLPFIMERQSQGSVFPPSENRFARNGDSFERTEWGKVAQQSAGSAGKVHALLNIGMASHSGVIQEVCHFATRSSSNNAVVEMLLLVEVHGAGSEIVVRQQSGTCVQVMDAPKQTHNLVLRDVANCKYPFDFTKAFVSGSDTGMSECEEDALADDAYPTVPASS